jgi:hypothetical protein
MSDKDAKELLDFRFQTLDEKLDGIADTLKNMETFLYVGNGKPSLKARVETLETAADDSKKRSFEDWKVRVAVGLAILGAVLPNVVKGAAWVVGKLGA